MPNLTRQSKLYNARQYYTGSADIVLRFVTVQLKPPLHRLHSSLGRGIIVVMVLTSMGRLLLIYIPETLHGYLLFLINDSACR